MVFPLGDFHLGPPSSGLAYLKLRPEGCFGIVFKSADQEQGGVFLF